MGTTACKSCNLSTILEKHNELVLKVVKIN